MTRTAVGTIVAKNFVSFARVLADSFRRHHPAVPLFVVLADEVDGCFAPSAEPFHLLHLRDLAIPDLASSRFHSTREQVAIASKPYLLSHLVERGFERVVFLDPDILVLSDLTSLFDEAGRHSVTLTPHLLKPPSAAEGVNRELNILQSGIYNAGFIGVSNTQRARDFLVWWRDRLRDHCRRDVAQGMFYDQRWLDLAPVFFEDVHVLRDPAVNVAYWNLPERDVRLDGDRVLVDGEPCRFFHFSGFDPDQPLAVTKYASRLTMADAGPAAELYAQYLRLLDAAGYHETKAWPYAYGHFDNGVPIPGVARQLHRELGFSSGHSSDILSFSDIAGYLEPQRQSERPRFWQKHAGDSFEDEFAPPRLPA